MRNESITETQPNNISQEKETPYYDIRKKKWISIKEGMLYTGLCRNTLAKITDEAHAIHHIGRRVLINREKLDAYLEGKTSTTN